MPRRKAACVSVALAAAMSLAAAAFAATAAAAPVTSRVSFEPDGSQRTDGAFNPSISADGAQVAYQVWRGTPFDDEGLRGDIYLYDRPSGKTEWISAGPLGIQGNHSSEDPAISANGRFVAFSSSSDNLVPGDTNDRIDIFVRDRRTGGLERISDGRPGGGQCRSPSISADGRLLAFASAGSRASIGGKVRRDVLLRDRETGATGVVSPRVPKELLSSDNPSVSAGGRFVAFEFGSGGIQVRDRALKRTQALSAPGVPHSGLAISAAGRFVAFSSDTRLSAGEENWSLPDDVFVHDGQTGRTELINVATNGARGNDFSGGASISRHGRYVAFASRASNLVPHDTNGVVDVFVRDRSTGTTRRVSISSARNQANGSSSSSYYKDGSLFGFDSPSLSARGAFVAFGSGASNLVRFDTNQTADVFVRGPLTP